MSLIFDLEGHDYIELNNLLKVTGLCHSGGIAKRLIEEGEVEVDGLIETRKRCKIRHGQQVRFSGEQIDVK
nr:RNA-binding S4 domain-containing protein [uncultured Desulfuromonas sp.]